MDTTEIDGRWHSPMNDHLVTIPFSGAMCLVGAK